ncbi:Mur ligase family protein [Cryobacterium sp. N22]|uniref:Mur ligase family protein n=1 Tax=Cryobacterium sp. N22 TaxID=2048290 RepID=UPI000CE43046|nr:UDP-N-acetylmuramoyl-L-alanyl-D-glutamate--2,6-diaminopimelate ligase [Cryobacterium sp. N22]
MTDLAPSALRPQHPVPRSLSGLVDEFELDVRGDTLSRELTGVSLSSRTVQPGDLFVGVPGMMIHGASHARAAREAGAVAVLTDEAGALLAADCGLPILVTADVRAALGAVAAWIHRTAENPADLFAVTGTNGKTSVVYLLFAILSQLGVVAGLTSTAERRIGDIAVTSALTTPEASELHALLARMREAEVRAVGIEVSAQAISRHRVDGLVFDVAGFTNLSHDHLDDYASMEEYFQSKLELFQPDRSRRGVVTVDSEWGRRIAAESRIPVTTLANNPVVGSADADRSPVDADWRMNVVQTGARFTEFTLDGPDGRRLQTRVPLLGWYMAANAALAIVMLVESGFDLAAIEHALTRDGGINAYIPGRAELISGDRGPLVYIDYGHSPDAFLNTLGAIRDSTAGRIIMVFGADGDRDKTKRDAMGAIAARGADAVVITDFHPRFEDPATIRATLLAAARAAVPERELYEVPDPATAFRRALSLAAEGDVVLYAGPGHENYQEVAGVKLPYSARDDARLALQEAGWL